MFAVQITECVFSLKKFRTSDPHPPVVWDKTRFFSVTFPNPKYAIPPPPPHIQTCCIPKQLFLNFGVSFWILNLTTLTWLKKERKILCPTHLLHDIHGSWWRWPGADVTRSTLLPTSKTPPKLQNSTLLPTSKTSWSSGLIWAAALFSFQDLTKQRYK